MSTKDKSKILVDGKELYSVEVFEIIDKNRFHIELYHKKHGHKSYDIELLSKIDANPVTLLINRKYYEVQLREMGTKNFRVKSREWIHQARILEGLIYATKKIKPYQELRPSTYKTQIKEKPVLEKGTITAPMAGIISSIKVKMGGKVKYGEVILTLNAMKMENEICTTKDGEVKEIMVEVGNGVKEGDSLIVID